MIFLRIGYLYGRRHGLRPVNFTMTEFLLIYALPFVLVFFVFLYFYMRYHEMHFSKFFRYLKPMSEAELSALKSFPYYSKLPAKKRSKFRRRVKHFVITKEYSGEGGIEVTDEMKVQIAAACAQLTIGFKPVFLSNFETIRVFNEDQKADGYLKRKELPISWKAFQEGYAIGHDGNNHGIRMLAQALNLETKISDSIDMTFGESPYQQWLHRSKECKEKFLKNFQIDLNATEDEEFFAIATVYFFEQPVELKAKFPALYHCLKHMFKQDPEKGNVDAESVARKLISS